MTAFASAPTLESPAAAPAGPAPCDAPPAGEAGEFTVRQAVQMTGLGEHTLRYYERAGLIRPVRRQASSRHRRYSAEDIARLHTLACLRAAGMPLERMRRYFELLEQGASAAPLQHAMLAAQREVLQRRLHDLRGHLDYLERKIRYWRAVEAGDQAAADAIAQEILSRINSSPERP